MSGGRAPALRDPGDRGKTQGARAMATGLSERLPADQQQGLWARLTTRMRRATWNGRRIDWSAYLFILPFIIGSFVFLLAPIVFGGYVSFTQWGIVGDPTWVG